jgi:hypothetical protein
MELRTPLTSAEKQRAVVYLALTFLLLCLIAWLWVDIERMESEIQALKEHDHALVQAAKRCNATLLSSVRSPECDEFNRLANHAPVGRDR